MGAILLAGGAEFHGQMAEPDLRAIALTGKSDVCVCIIPTAAAPDNNHLRAGDNGVRWFKSLGVQRVRSLAVIDKTSSNNINLADILASADLIYLLGGFPDYLEKTLRASRCWSAILDAYQRGSVLAGSSAGAMVLCEWFLNPKNRSIQAGLGIISNAIVIPHFETMGELWVQTIGNQLPGITIIGIDEQTGMIREEENDQWTVYGKGIVTIYQDNKLQTYSAKDRSFGLTTSGKILR